MNKKSLSITDRIDKVLDAPSYEIYESNLNDMFRSVCGSYFKSRTDLQKHLTESATLAVNKLVSTYIGIPEGEYAIYNVNSNKTQLLNTKELSNDVYEPIKFQEVFTKDILDNWRNFDGPISESGKKDRIQKSHSKYPRNSNVKNAVETSGSTQEEIANAIGVDPSTVSRWTAKTGDGARRPSIDNAIEFSKRVGSDVEDIFSSGRTQNRKKRHKTSGSGGGRNPKYRGK